MARKTVTTYLCDSCGKTVERPKDLKKFTVLLSEGTGRYYSPPSVTGDLCDACELAFLTDLVSYFGDEEAVLQLRRAPAKEKA